MKNQSGRSMIEMLGVLAIIGVLSLGGVAVFNAAMNRQTANNLTYDVMLMAESTVSLGPQEQMPFDASTEYNQMSSARDANGIVNVTVQDVENDICEVLLSKAGNDVFEFRDAGGNALDACADDTTDVVFAFTGDGFGGNNPVNPDENNCPIGCPDDHICVDGQCCANLIPTGVCEVAATATCPAFKRECGAGKYCSEGECLTCDLSHERCQNCGYENEGGDWIEDLDNCGIFDPNTCSCDPYCEDAESAATEEECMACGDMYIWIDNRCIACAEEQSYFGTWAEAYAAAEQCNQRGVSLIPAVNTDVDRKFILAFESEECPEERGYGQGYFVPMSRKRCLACSLSTAWSYGLCMIGGDWCGTGAGPRNQCSSIFTYDLCPCYCRNPITCDSNDCYCGTPSEEECPLTESVSDYLTEEQCNACGNAIWDGNTCYDCGYSGDISFDTEAEAEACVSACAGSGYERTAEGRYCYRSPNTTCPLETERIPNMTKSVCEACANTVWSDDDGACYDCGYKYSISFDTEAEAEACVAACADSGYPREVDKSGDVYYCNQK